MTGKSKRPGSSNALRGSREKTVRVKTAGKRPTSSTRWLERQLNDPYVAAAKRAGYRSRAAFKLIELDDRFKLLKRGQHCVDLGAAPGGWAQVCAERTGADGKVVAVDINAFDPLPGVEVMQGDVYDLDLPAVLLARLDGRCDVVLSDMAPPATGHRATDHLRIMALAEAAYEIAREILSPGGCFVAKVWQGGTENELLARIKLEFAEVRHAKPPASRQDSAEIYLVAKGYRGETTA